MAKNATTLDKKQRTLPWPGSLFEALGSSWRNNQLTVFNMNTNTSIGFEASLFKPSAHEPNPGIGRFLGGVRCSD